MLKRKLSQLARFVGNTRMVCNRIMGVNICFKLEYDNPTGSHKDRIALYMIKGLIDDGRLKEGDCVAELSSGNTATSVAWVASFLGLRSFLMVRRNISSLKKKLIKLYGGELLEVEESLSEEDARRLAEEHGCILLGQHANEYNFIAHYETTGKEILEQTHHGVTYFVMGIGTGGTITGVGARLKEELDFVKVIGVVPVGSALSRERGIKFEAIEGLLGHKVPEIVNRHRDVIDHVVDVSPRDALRAIVDIHKNFSILPGPSTGANFVAILNLIREGFIQKGDLVVSIAADRLTRYPELLELINQP